MVTSTAKATGHSQQHTICKLGHKTKTQEEEQNPLVHTEWIEM